jgi:hypothetical protein
MNQIHELFDKIIWKMNERRNNTAFGEEKHWLVTIVIQ